MKSKLEIYTSIFVLSLQSVGYIYGYRLAQFLQEIQSEIQEYRFDVT